MLKDEGFILDYQVGREVKDETGQHISSRRHDAQADTRPFCASILKYGPEGERVIRHIERASRPGRRLYRRTRQLRPVLDGLGISIFSTSRGVMSDRQARDPATGRRTAVHGVVTNAVALTQSRAARRNEPCPESANSPWPIPPASRCVLADGKVRVEGPKGKLELAFHRNMKVELDEKAKVIKVTRPDDERLNRALHGLTRSLIANMVEGVTKGYEKKLKIEGIGYQAHWTRRPSC